jgi:serine/threonine-protein kinase/endoribonuclease IRE1
LADFGYAIQIGTSSSAGTSTDDFLQLRRVVSGNHGTRGFKPYELLRAMRSRGGVVMNNAALMRADIFGLGCVLFFLLSKGKHPFGDDTMSRDEKILKRSKVSWFDRISSIQTKTLLSSTLSHDAEKRPSSKEVLHILMKK